MMTARMNSPGAKPTAELQLRKDPSVARPPAGPSKSYFYAFCVVCALAVALTAEETVHLRKHLLGSAAPGISSLHPTDCVHEGADDRVYRCHIDGFNSALYLCSPLTCAMKEPANGTRVTVMEQRHWDAFMVDHTQAPPAAAAEPATAAETDARPQR